MTNNEAAIELLLKAKAKLPNEEAWTQGEYARDAEGAVAYLRPEKATCFCTMGAVRAATGAKNLTAYSVSTTKGYLNATKALGEAIDARNTHFSVPSFNDDPETTLQDVWDLIDEAIEILRSKQ